MKRFALILIFMFLIGLSGCISEDVPLDDFFAPGVATPYQTIYDDAQVAYESFDSLAINESLATFAKLLARLANNDEDFRAFIGNEVGKKFDGDFDVLYERVADISVNGKTLRNEAQKLLKDSNINEVTSIVPYLHLAIPVNYDLWSTYTGEIYVIPLRYDTDDLKPLGYTGYDQNGKSRFFSAKNPPDEPVLVVGINERFEYMMQNGLDQKQAGITSGTSDGSVTHQEILEGILLNDPRERWLQGKPEPYIVYAIGDEYSKGVEFLFDASIIGEWNDVNLPFVTISNYSEFMQYVLLLREYDATSHAALNIDTTFYYDGLTRIVKANFPPSYGISVGDDNFDTELPLVPFNHYETNYEYMMGSARVKLGYKLE